MGCNFSTNHVVQSNRPSEVDFESKSKRLSKHLHVYDKENEPNHALREDAIEDIVLHSNASLELGLEDDKDELRHPSTAVETNFQPPQESGVYNNGEEEDIEDTSQYMVDIYDMDDCAIDNGMKQTMEGNMKKKSPSMLAGWQMRYCVLHENSIFSYYGSELEYRTNKDPKGSFHVSNLLKSKYKDILSEGTCQFNLELRDRLFEFECESEEIAKEWYECLLTHLKIDEDK